MLDTMPSPTIHLATPTPRALCGIMPTYWTRDINAVTCPACIAATELAPA